MAFKRDETRSPQDDFTEITHEDVLQLIRDRASEISMRTGYSINWIESVFQEALNLDEDESNSAGAVEAAMTLYRCLMVTLEQPELCQHAEGISVTVLLPRIIKDGEDISPWPAASGTDYFAWHQSEVPLRDSTPLNESDAVEFSSLSSDDIHAELESMVKADEEYDESLSMGWRPVEADGKEPSAFPLFLYLLTTTVKEIPVGAEYLPGRLILNLYDENSVENIVVLNEESGEHVHVPFLSLNWQINPMNLIPCAGDDTIYGEISENHPGFNLFEEMVKYFSSCECGECDRPVTIAEEERFKETADSFTRCIFEHSEEEGSYYLSALSLDSQADTVSSTLSWNRVAGGGVQLEKDMEDPDPFTIAALTYCGEEFSHGSLTLSSRHVVNGKDQMRFLGWAVIKGKVLPLSAQDMQEVVEQSQRELRSAPYPQDMELVFLDAFDLDGE